MYSKKLKFANAVLDILYVFLTQIAIIFMVIVIPCIIVLLKAAGMAESSEFVLQNMSFKSMRTLIDQSAFINFCKVIVGPISIAVAPFVYEKLKDSRKKENRALLQAYRQGGYLDFQRLLSGCLTGLLCAGALIGVTALCFGTKKFCFPADNISLGMTFLNLISICLFCVCQELFIRHYCFLKTAQFSVIGYIVLTNLIFAFNLFRTIDKLNVQCVLAVLLLSLRMTFQYLRTKNIAANFGFRAVFEMLMFMFFGDAHFVNNVSILLLFILLTVEVVNLLMKKERFGLRNEELQ